MLEQIFCLLKNSPEFLISLFAVMKTGAVFVPINTELRGQFLEHQYLNCEPKIAIIDNTLLDIFNDIKPQKKRLKGTIITDTFDSESLPTALHSEETLEKVAGHPELAKYEWPVHLEFGGHD